MRVLLIQPPLSDEMISLGILEPLGLEVLAGALDGHEVEILDMRVDDGLEEKLQAFDPDVVGITAVSVEASNARKVAGGVKAFDSGIDVIVGGHHATMIPEDFRMPPVDVVVMGAGYHTFGEVLDALAEGGDLTQVSNLLVADGGQWIRTEREPITDVENMPIPDREATRPYRRDYRLLGSPLPVALLVTSLGCPYRCDFCGCWKMHEGHYHERTIKDIVEDLKRIEEKQVFFGDDNTLCRPKRARKLCRAISENGIDKLYTGYARADTIAQNPDLIREWKQVGLSGLVVGYEGICDRQLDEFNKKSELKTNEEAFRILDENGIMNLAHFVVTQDFQKEDFEALYRYVEKWDLTLPFFTVLTPLPGTELWKRKKHQIRDDTYNRFDLAHNVLPAQMGEEKFARHYAQLYRRAYSTWRTLKLALRRREPSVALLKLVFMRETMRQAGSA